MWWELHFHITFLLIILFFHDCLSGYNPKFGKHCLYRPFSNVAFDEIRKHCKYYWKYNHIQSRQKEIQLAMPFWDIQSNQKQIHLAMPFWDMIRSVFDRIQQENTYFFSKTHAPCLYTCFIFLHLSLQRKHVVFSINVESEKSLEKKGGHKKKRKHGLPTKSH